VLYSSLGHPNGPDSLSHASTEQVDHLPSSRPQCPAFARTDPTKPEHLLRPIWPWRAAARWARRKLATAPAALRIAFVGGGALDKVPSETLRDVGRPKVPCSGRVEAPVKDYHHPPPGGLMEMSRVRSKGHQGRSRGSKGGACASSAGRTAANLNAFRGVLSTPLNQLGFSFASNKLLRCLQRSPPHHLNRSFPLQLRCDCTASDR
jgi:hypothetical protein